LIKFDNLRVEHYMQILSGHAYKSKLPTWNQCLRVPSHKLD